MPPEDSLLFTRLLKRNDSLIPEPLPEVDLRTKFLRGVMMFWMGQLVCGAGWAIALMMAVFFFELSTEKAQSEANMQTGLISMAVVGFIVGMFFGTLLWMASIPLRRPDWGNREVFTIGICMMLGFSGAMILYFQNQNMAKPYPLWLWLVYIGVVVAITLLFMGYCRMGFKGLFGVAAISNLIFVGGYTGIAIHSGSLMSLPGNELLIMLFLTLLWWPIPITIAVLQYFHDRWTKQAFAIQ